VSLI
jgi:uncharacterized protein YlxW (UPF0749 family)